MENTDRNDMAFLDDRSSRLTAEKLILRCGVRADLKGFDYLADAVILSGTGACSRICEIYARIGQARHAKPKSVMRAISYAVDNAPDLPRRLGDMIGITISAADIHNALIIAYLGKLFGSPSLSAFA